MATIVGFLKGDTLFLPTAECLDILFEMMETCQNIAGILSFSVEVPCTPSKIVQGHL